jgi:hypothetical protein
VFPPYHYHSPHAEAMSPHSEAERGLQERDDQISRLRQELVEVETEFKRVTAKEGKLARLQTENQAIREDRDKLLKISDQLLTDAEAAKATRQTQTQ